MPYLSLENQPPSPAKTSHKADGRKDGPMESTNQNSEKVAAEEIPTTYCSEQDMVTNTYPVVQLDVDTISDAVAGRLASSLLGHVLFLKNQVPFPVLQLGRLPCGKANSRAFKQRAELLASYDTISSHFSTTFSALSTAFARCANTSSSKKSQAHVAILVGPSPGTAKSKVILAIDGIETRVWGIREDTVPKPWSKVIHDDDDDEDSEEEEQQNDNVNDGNDGADDDESSGEEPEESDDEEDEEDDESEASDASEDGHEEEDESETGLTASQSSPSYISYAEEQKFLQNAERLLSRTLAAADAEGSGISSEMAPTQTHVLLRAPRRFCHPAWIPRQNVTAALDTALGDFIVHSGLSTTPSSPPRRNGSYSSKKNKVEGVWITARSGIQRPSGAQNDPSVHVKELSPEDDADEMIWWSWDGKFVGFNDW